MRLRFVYQISALLILLLLTLNLLIYLVEFFCILCFLSVFLISLSDAQMEFVSIFQEGKELADQSEILEQPAAGGSLNPETLYYGQGADE